MSDWIHCEKCGPIRFFYVGNRLRAGTHELGEQIWLCGECKERLRPEEETRAKALLAKSAAVAMPGLD